MKRTKIIGAVDRISELPECIIHRIMSYLPPKEVVRACVLSKAWYNFKVSYPVLDFNEKPFLEKSLGNFTQLVYNSLLQFRRFNLPLQSFSVSVYKSSNFPDLDSWIRSALENGLEKLNLSSRSVDDYFLPQPVFLSKTLSILNVESCVLNKPLSLFSSLKKLFLRSCRIDCPIILEKGDCPLLEEFVCDDCEFNRVIRISDLLRLQTVDVMIGLVEEFVVSGQSIQSITIRDDSGPPTVVNINGCNHLKLLHLMSDNMTDTQFHHLLSKLPLLEELYLFHCYTLEEIKISNPKLKTLVVSLEFQTSLKILEIAAPSLKSFIFTSDLSIPNFCKIKVADCCCSLETLVLFKYFATEGVIQNLISKFPLLENLWMIGFMELERMRVQNLRLRRLHFVGCLNLKAVEVYSPNLFEFHCAGRESPKFSVADMKASGGLKFEDETSRIWLKRFKRMLINIVGIKDDDLLGMISVA